MPERPKRRKNNKNKRKNKNKPESVQLKSDACSSYSQDNVPCEASDKVDDMSNKVDDILSQKILDSSCLNVSSNTANCESDKTLQNDDKKQQVPLPEQDLNNNNDHVELSSNSNGNISKYKGVEDYVVESPDQSLKAKPKLTDLKSKSLDNDDAPKIIELSEDSNVQSEDDTLAIIDSSNVTVSDVESDVEWEKTDDLNKNTDIPTKDIAHGTLSVTAIPLNIAQCDFTKSLTLDEERSLRQYLSSLNLATNPSNTFEIKEEIEHIINREVRHRLRKKGLAEDIPMLRPGPSRTLDVIDEEGSCDSSTSSRRHSYLNDKKHKNEDLDDNVFEDLKKNTDKYMTSRPTKSKINLGRQIPQECVLVDAKIVEPKMSEVRGEWSVKTVEQLTGAEVVYLTDSSSSTSSLYEVDNETDDGVETDVSVRIITPTIEVTDTENLLKRSFLKDTDETLKNHDKNITADNNDNITPENSHEIVILSTDDIKTDLYVKNIDDIDTDNKTLKQPQKSDTYDVEIKVIKCELNNAINNLISSDCENQIDNTKDTFVRQDSSSSVCSSQCTAKYNPSHSSLNDVSNFVHDEAGDNNNTNPENGPYKTPSNVSHVKDVFDSVTGLKRDWTSFNGKETKKLAKNPWSLKDLCVRRIASFPYGEKILEELASVSKRLQNITVLNANTAVLNETRATATKSTQKKANIKDNYNSNHMPYFPLPDVSYIDQISLPVQQKDTAPPPIQPRHSSLKSHDDRHWSAVPTKQEPLYVCLSPSQKMLMEKTNTFITKEDATQLYESHKKFVDRRGYNEKSKMTEEHNAEAPIVSFKSQTGSRLLALIRDPTVAGNINSSVNSRFNRSVDNIHKNFKNFETMSRNNTDRSTSLRDTSSSFRPIPPPRPKKLSAFYESDESSDFTDSSLRSMKNERKSFHYSTGNLTREIEQDVSSIQNMHRYYTNLRDQNNQASPRRPSLPKDLCDQQMEYIRQKEKEVEAELKRLEYEKTNHIAKKGPRAPLLSEKDIVENLDINNSFSFHKKGYEHIATFTENVNKGKLSVFSSSQEELLRDKMYSEYVNQMAERQERKQHKVIKLSNYPTSSNKAVSKSMSSVDKLESKVNNRIEKEFICKARERWNKLGIRDPETEDETESNKDIYREPKVIEHKIKVIEGDKEKDVQKLPNHLQEFVEFTADKDRMGESNSGPASPHAVIWCAVIIVILAVSRYFLRFLRNK